MDALRRGVVCYRQNVVLVGISDVIEAGVINASADGGGRRGMMMMMTGCRRSLGGCCPGGREVLGMLHPRWFLIVDRNDFHSEGPEDMVLGACASEGWSKVGRVAFRGDPRWEGVVEALVECHAHRRVGDEKGSAARVQDPDLGQTTVGPQAHGGSEHELTIDVLRRHGHKVRIRREIRK